MKIQSAFFACLVAVCSAQAVAQDSQDNACAALLCMSGPGSQLPHQCKQSTDAFFDIRVYKKKTFSTVFDPAKTAAKRRDTLLATCDGARQIDIDETIAKFGPLEYSPFGFSF